MLSSGQLLVERYRLTTRIAVGGMGEVWQASDNRLDRTVAIKVLKAELCDNAEFLHRFRTEARMTASLNHSGIAAVHDYGETVTGEQSIAYLVMELVEGDPLAGILAREGRMSAIRTLDILEQAGNGLQAAHEQGLVHRDIKPGNILITPGGKVKITDFGIAKAADAVPVTRSGMVMGTAHYIAPEQALGHNAEPASDVYSLAVCGYECLTGHRPFRSENAVTVAMMHIHDLPPPLPPNVPPGVRAVIEATLIKDPQRRYHSGGEFAAAVAAVRSGYPLPAPAGLAAGASLTTANLSASTPVNVAYGPPRLGSQLSPGGPNAPPMPPGVMRSIPLSPITDPTIRRDNRTGWWVLLAVILLALMLTGVLVVAKLVHSGSGEPPEERQPDTPLRTQPADPPPPSPPTDEPPTAKSAAPADPPPAHWTWGPIQNYGPQGMMDTPWTEWNGTQR